MKKASKKEKIIYALLIVLGLLMTLPVLALASNNIVFSIVAGSVLAIVGFLCYIFLKKALLPAIFVGGVPLAIALLISALLFAEIGGEIFVLALALVIPVSSFLFIFTVLGGWIAVPVYKIRASKAVKSLPEEPEQNGEENALKSDTDTDDVEQERVGKDKRGLCLNIIIYTAFALAIIVVTFLTFLFNIEVAYRPDRYGWVIVPAYYEIFYYSVGISLIFCLVAVIIWAIFNALLNKKINIAILLILALLIPRNQTTINWYLFDKEGPLYSTVQKGGELFFVVTRDFDLDGEYDEKYRLIYDDREVIVNYEDGSNNEGKTEIDNIEVRIIGRGTELEKSIVYINRHESSIDKSTKKYICVYSKYNTTVESVEIYVTPRKNKDPQKFEFRGDNIDVTSEVLDDGRIKLTVDSEEISRRENENKEHAMSFDIYFDYKE